MKFDIFNVVKEGLIYTITLQNTFGGGVYHGISMFDKSLCKDCFTRSRGTCYDTGKGVF